MRFTESFSVERPVEDVFARLGDAERIPEWWTEFASVEKLSSGDVGVGTTYRCRRSRRPRADWTLEWVAYEPDSLLSWRMTSEAPVTRAGTYACEPDGGAQTRVTVELQSLVSGKAGRLGLWLFSRLTLRHARKDVALLRQWLSRAAVVAGLAGGHAELWQAVAL